MKEIEMYPGVTIDYAYEQLMKHKAETGEEYFCKFNDKELYSINTLDEMYLKVTRKTKAQYDKDLQDKHNAYLRREAEFRAKIPQLIKEYRAKARGIIADKYLKKWDEVVPIRLADLYHGMELECLLYLITELNTDKSKDERFKNCLQLFIQQGHSGMSANLIFGGLYQFHELGSQLVDYIKKHWI